MWLSGNTLLLVNSFNADKSLLGGKKTAELVKWLIHGSDRAQWDYAIVDATTGHRSGDALERLKTYTDEDNANSKYLFGNGCV